MKQYTFTCKGEYKLFPTKYDVIITDISTPKDYGIKLMNKRKR